MSTITRTHFDDLVNRLLNNCWPETVEALEPQLKALIRDYWERVDIIRFRNQAERITGETIEIVD